MVRVDIRGDFDAPDIVAPSAFGDRAGGAGRRVGLGQSDRRRVRLLRIRFAGLVRGWFLLLDCFKFDLA